MNQITRDRIQKMGPHHGWESLSTVAPQLSFDPQRGLNFFLDWLDDLIDLSSAYSEQMLSEMAEGPWT